MTGFTDLYAGQTLKNLVAVSYIGLFTGVGTDSGAGFTEVSGGNYSRLNPTPLKWNTPSGSAPSIITNSAPLVFPVSNAIWGSILAIGFFDNPNAGNLLAWDYLGNFPWLEFTATNASPSILTAPAHGYSNNDTVVVNAEYGGGVLPPPNLWNGLLTVANITTDTFNVSINSTATGSGEVRKVAAQQINNNIQTIISAGTATLSSA